MAQMVAIYINANARIAKVGLLVQDGVARLLLMATPAIAANARLNSRSVMKNRPTTSCATPPSRQVADDVQAIIKRIFQSCRKLSRLAGRPFSPDGHLVGSFGEVIARDWLNLRLMPPSTEGYDAIDKQGRRVEIKATTRNAISLSASGTKAQRLVVVQIGENGDAEIAYDGPAETAWYAAGEPQKNGQRRISISTLKELAG